MPRRVAIVGTDTEIGKTHLVEALLHAATDAGRRVLPFKPAQSGPDRPSDAERLARACSLPVAAADICPLIYGPPLAPGIAHDREQFLQPRPELDPAPSTPPSPGSPTSRHNTSPSSSSSRARAASSSPCPAGHGSTTGSAT